jgi:hypothetical protein
VWHLTAIAEAAHVVTAEAFFWKVKYGRDLSLTV